MFRPGDRGKAIGAWSGYSGVGTAVGPFLGGWLIQAGSWRLIFVINLPLAALVVAVAMRHVPESRDPEGTGLLDHPERLVAEDEPWLGPGPAACMCRSVPQIALEVTRMTTSEGSSRTASGTSRTSTLRVPATLPPS